MTLSDLASIATVISGMAVLGSLVYLSLQTRQNTKHTMALIQQGRSNQVTARVNEMTSDPSLLEIVLRGAAGDQTMNDAQAARYVLYVFGSFFNYEDQFYQHSEGLVDDARHAGLINTINSTLSNPGSRAVWSLMRGRFDAGFQNFMDDMMREVPRTPYRNLGGTWKSMVGAELPEAGP